MTRNALAQTTQRLVYGLSVQTTGLSVCSRRTIYVAEVKNPSFVLAFSGVSGGVRFQNVEEKFICAPFFSPFFSRNVGFLVGKTTPPCVHL